MYHEYFSIDASPGVFLHSPDCRVKPALEIVRGSMFSFHSSYTVLLTRYSTTYSACCVSAAPEYAARVSRWITHKHARQLQENRGKIVFFFCYLFMCPEVHISCVFPLAAGGSRVVVVTGDSLPTNTLLIVHLSISPCRYFFVNCTKNGGKPSPMELKHHESVHLFSWTHCCTLRLFAFDLLCLLLASGQYNRCPYYGLFPAVCCICTHRPHGVARSMPPPLSCFFFLAVAHSWSSS